MCERVGASQGAQRQGPIEAKANHAGRLHVLEPQHHVADVLVGDTGQIKQLERLDLAALKQRPQTLLTHFLGAHGGGLVRRERDRLEILPASHHAAENSIRDGMLSAEALNVGASSGDGTNHFGGYKPAVAVAVVQ